MICPEYKTIFIHIPKTAGTSIECMFDFVEFDPETNTMKEMHRKAPGKHWNIEYIKQNYPEEFENYFKWTIVRNPWEKDWSFYNMMKYISRMKLSFKDFLKKIVEPAVSSEAETRTKREWHAKHVHSSQFSFIAINGENVMDEVIRFEDLNDGWRNICNQINKPYKKMVHLRNPPKGSMQEDYDQECIDLVAKLRKKDIEYFKYDLPNQLEKS